MMVQNLLSLPRIVAYLSIFPFAKYDQNSS